jgi:hypothetical protein
MSEQKTDNKKDTLKATETAASAAKGTVSKFFTKFKTKSYLLDAFCLMHKSTPESELTEADFNRKLKEFQNHKIG